MNFTLAIIETGLKLNTLRKLRALGFISNTRGEFSTHDISKLTTKFDPIEWINFCSTENGICSARMNMMGDLQRAMLRDKLPVHAKNLPLLEQLWWCANSITDWPLLCEECTSPIKIFLSFSKGYAGRFCSLACKGKSDAVKSSVKGTVLSRYGVSNVAQMPITKETVKNTVLTKYGKHPLSDLKIRESAMLAKYGVKHPMQNPESKKKRARTNRMKLLANILNCGYENIGKDKWRCLEHNFTFITSLHGMSGARNGCRKCFPARQSKPEIEITAFVSGFIDVKTRDRTIIKPLELDIVIPTKNVAIEFNGIYWHSTKRLQNNKYHQAKHQACLSKGVSLIQIFEDEWCSKPDIVKSLIKTGLGFASTRIDSRECDVLMPTSAQRKKFLSENDIQGADKATFCSGLSYRGELVAVMTAQKAKNSDWEILRHCYKRDVIVHNGALEMWGALRKLIPGSVVVHVDARFGGGEVYAKLGFEEDQDLTIPDYHYVHPRTMLRLSGAARQKHKLERALGEGFDSTRTESENMDANGWFKVYDAGHYVYRLNT